MERKSTAPSVAVTTLGCKVNQFESAAFLSALAGRGVNVVPFNAEADIYIINTCAVTGRAGAQSRQLIRRALRANPEARLVVTGCYAQLAPKEVRDLVGDRPQQLRLVGNGAKDRLVETALAEGTIAPDAYLSEIASQREIAHLPATGWNGRTRTYLKVQDGCNSFCSYCIVPHTRGRSRSLAPDLVLAQAAVFAEQGYREQVITGIHLGHYGRDLSPQSDLTSLLALLVAKNLPVRYRLSSLEPTEIDDELLALMADSESLMPCLHIPLQSGDDRILARMNRRYTAARFTEVVEKSLARLPGAAIGVDVLVGFPGEDDAAFRNTADLLADLPVTSLHVFPYSRRPGTPAATLPDQIPAAVKKERVAHLRDLDRAKRASFYRGHLGSIRPVLVEGDGQNGVSHGFTDNYIPVIFPGAGTRAGQLVQIRLKSLDLLGVVLGEVADSEHLLK